MVQPTANVLKYKFYDILIEIKLKKRWGCLVDFKKYNFILSLFYQEKCFNINVFKQRDNSP